MDKLSSLTRFKASCPFLGRTQTSTLRTLCTNASPRFPSISVLTERATKCPVMGPALNVRGKELVAGYASVAGVQDVAQIHKDQGVSVPAGATIEMCPHASKARAAARMASDLAAAATKKAEAEKGAAKAAAAAGCPFAKAGAAMPAEHPPVPQVAATPAPAQAQAPPSFNYEGFYVNELDKKHQDKSYRYFNNINRLAAKFPIAHTSDVKDEVQVWCSNDYLGMGNNPVVLETMQYVFCPSFILSSSQLFLVVRSTSTATAPAAPVILRATAPCI